MSSPSKSNSKEPSSKQATQIKQQKSTDTTKQAKSSTGGRNSGKSSVQITIKSSVPSKVQASTNASGLKLTISSTPSTYMSSTFSSSRTKSSMISPMSSRNSSKSNIQNSNSSRSSSAISGSRSSSSSVITSRSTTRSKTNPSSTSAPKTSNTGKNRYKVTRPTKRTRRRFRHGRVRATRTFKTKEKSSNANAKSKNSGKAKEPTSTRSSSILYTSSNRDNSKSSITGSYSSLSNPGSLSSVKSSIKSKTAPKCNCGRPNCPSQKEAAKGGSSRLNADSPVFVSRAKSKQDITKGGKTAKGEVLETFALERGGGPPNVAELRRAREHLRPTTTKEGLRVTFATRPTGTLETLLEGKRRANGIAQPEQLSAEDQAAFDAGQADSMVAAIEQNEARLIAEFQKQLQSEEELTTEFNAALIGSVADTYEQVMQEMTKLVTQIKSSNEAIQAAAVPAPSSTNAFSSTSSGGSQPSPAATQDSKISPGSVNTSSASK